MEPGWLLWSSRNLLASYQADEVYIGTAEERAAKDHADHDSDMDVQAGHMYPVAEVLTPHLERYHTLEEIEEAKKNNTKHIAELENHQKRLAEAKTKFGVMKNWGI